MALSSRSSTAMQWVGPTSADQYYTPEKKATPAPVTQAPLAVSPGLSSRTGDGQTVISAKEPQPAAPVAKLVAPVRATTPIKTPGALKAFDSAEAERAYVETLTSSEARKHFGDAWGKMSPSESVARGALGVYGRRVLPFSYESDAAKAYYRKLATVPPEMQTVVAGEGFFTRTLKPILQNAAEMGLDSAELAGLAFAPDQAYPLLKQFTITARRQLGISEGEIASEASRMSTRDEYAAMPGDVKNMAVGMYEGFKTAAVGMAKYADARAKGDAVAADEIAAQMGFDLRQGLSQFMGLGDKARQAFGVAADKNAVYVKGEKVRDLTDAEKSVAGGMTAVGGLVNSLAVWSKVSPWIEAGVLKANPTTMVPLMEQHPILFRGIITNAIEETTQAMVSGIAGIPYNFGDTVFGLATQFGMTALGGAGRASVPELKDVDVAAAMKDADDAVNAFTVQNRRTPSTIELQQLIGERTIPGTTKTWNDTHVLMAKRFAGEFGENRLIARDTVEKFGRPDRPEGRSEDDTPLSEFDPQGVKDAEAASALLKKGATIDEAASVAAARPLDPAKRIELLERARELESRALPFAEDAAARTAEVLELRKQAIPELFEKKLPTTLFDEPQRTDGIRPFTKQTIATMGDLGRKWGGLQDRVLNLEKELSTSLPVTRTMLTQELGRQLALERNITKAEARSEANRMGNLALLRRVVRGGSFPELSRLLENYETLRSIHDGIAATAEQARQVGPAERGGSRLRAGRRAAPAGAGGDAGGVTPSRPSSGLSSGAKPEKASPPPPTPPSDPGAVSVPSGGLGKKTRKFVETLEKTDLTAPEVKDALATSPVREYQPITNKATLEEAQRIIDTSRDEAMGRINQKDARPDAVTTMIGMDMMRRLQNEGSYETVVDIAEKMAARHTQFGQANQALAVWGRLTPEGALVYAAKKIREIQDAAPGKGKQQMDLEDRVFGEMKKANEEAIDQVIDDVVEPIRSKKVSGSGKPKGSPADDLAQRIIKYAQPPRKNAAPDPVRDMVQTLLAVAKESIPAPEGRAPRDPMEFIVDAIRNRDGYRSVWEDAKATVAEKFKDDPSAMAKIEEYLENPLRSPFARRQVSNILDASIRDGGIDIGKIVREHYSSGYRTGEELRQALIERSGLTPADAQDLSIAIQRRFYELTNARKESILKQTFGERVVAERKTEAQRIIELSNLGAYDSPEYRLLAGEKLGVPTLTPEMAKDITDLANKVQESPEGSRDRMVNTALLMRYVDELKPVGIGKKIGTAQTIFMLLNPKSFVRNVFGGFGWVPAEAAAELVAWPIDAGMSYMLRTPRTRAMPAWIRGEFVGMKGLASGFKEGVEEALMGIDTRATESRYLGSGSSKGRRIFTDPIMGNLEKAMRVSLQGPDRAFYQRAVDVSLENQMRAAYGDNAKIMAPTADMLERAAYDGSRAVFEDESLLRTVFVKMKETMNIIGIPDDWSAKGLRKPKSFGLGDALLKFPGVPANIITRGLEFSPVGFVRTVVEGARPLFGERFDQREFVDSFARAAVGTSGLIATGAQLARIGVITGAPEEDSEINAVQRELGMGQYKLNSSALYRYVTSGFNSEAGKRREGDVLYSYDWMQPHAIGLSMGANIFFHRDKQLNEKTLSTLATVLASTEGALETIEEQPLLKSLRRFTQGDKSLIKRFVASFKDMPATFIPSFINQITQLTDNVARETYDPNPGAEILNTIQAKIPGLSSRLPPRINPTTGKVQFRYQNDSNNLFNVFFNPAFVTRVKDDPAMQEVLGIYERTGDARGAPRVVPRQVTVNGMKRELDGTEIATYQQYVAKEMRWFYDQIIQTPQWDQAGDDMKADELQKILNGVNQAAKIQLFGDRPKSVSNYAQQILLRRGFRP